MTVISMKKLLEVGVHFGHQTKRWNPKMAPYIFTARNGIYIIDLQKSSKMIDEAYKAMNAIAAKGGKVLFVGTKKQAQKSIDTAISKNPKNLNYKRLKAEIYSQSNRPQEGVKLLNDLNSGEINTIIFDKELHSSQQYILYKAAKNEYWKKYHLAYYYYDEHELSKALRVLQTSISGKKNINKEVYLNEQNNLYVHLSESEGSELTNGEVSVKLQNQETFSFYHTHVGEQARELFILSLLGKVSICILLCP